MLKSPKLCLGKKISQSEMYAWLPRQQYFIPMFNRLARWSGFNPVERILDHANQRRVYTVIDSW